MNKFIDYASRFSLTDKQINVEELRKKFIKTFTYKNLANLSLEEYAIGQGTKTDFCYLLENGLKELGDIHGATAIKFGVYYSNEDNDYRWAKWTNNDFNIVRQAIIELYHAGETEDIDEIKENPLSPMFKGKILSVYFPERYLNVFADHHLEYFLNKLSISYPKNMNTVELRELLINYKRSKNEFSHLTAITFGYCLYEYFGKPTKEEIDIQNESIEEFNDIQQNLEIDSHIITKKEFKVYGDIPIKKPELIEASSVHSYKRNTDKSLQSIREANYQCEIDANHKSFLRKDRKHLYTEAHHIIPMSVQDEFDNSLDTPANIVSLCSNCHNWLHYGADNDILLKALYDLRIDRLKKCGLNITFSKLKSYYK